jgi:hypothetical protein
MKEDFGMKRSIMKVFFVVALSCGVFLAGCGKNDESSKDDGKDKTEESGELSSDVKAEAVE